MRGLACGPSLEFNFNSSARALCGTARSVAILVEAQPAAANPSAITNHGSQATLAPVDTGSLDLLSDCCMTPQCAPLSPLPPGEG